MCSDGEVVVVKFQETGGESSRETFSQTSLSSLVEMFEVDVNSVEANSVVVMSGLSCR